MEFVRKIWEARLLDLYTEVSPLSVISTAPDDMTANSIVFNRAKAGTVSDYAGTVSWEALDTDKVEMLFDCKKYFAFTVDDVDKAQSNIAIVDGLARNQANKLGDVTAAYAYAKMADGAGNKTGKNLPAVTLSDTVNIYDAIVDLGTALGKNKVPVSDRYVIIGWDALGMLQKDKRFTHNPEVLENGIISGQKIAGMTLVVTANAPDQTVIAMHKSAFGFGQQINELEAMRLENKFADGIRGLSVAGGAVLNPDGVVACTYSAG